MNKKANGLTMAIIFLFLISFLFIIMIIVNISEEKECKKACGEKAFDYEAKSRGSFIDALTGKDKLTCVCYYDDEIKTKKLR